jgi:FkbM family methyltransferase
MRVLCQIILSARPQTRRYNRRQARKTIALNNPNLLVEKPKVALSAPVKISCIFPTKLPQPNEKVYAFEPHSANFTRLVENISCNRLQAVVIPSNIPLHSQEGYAYFNYDSTAPGSSNSQHSSSLDEPDNCQPAVMAELKYATSIDRLIESGFILPAHHVKIDIDGKELDVLNGMINFLKSMQRPRTVQVELNSHRNDEIYGLMQDLGYRLVDKHYSRSASRRLTQTGSEPEFSCNAIFLGSN